tara:strand:+ start:12181 stop:12480 length:300 start_codon:yes stop_codon:yes gene_type:complete
MSFDGVTFDERLDGDRLRKQWERVRDVMLDGRWHTLQEIGQRAGVRSDASVSARIRDLRKARFGGYAVDRERVEGGLWVYRLREPEPAGQRRLFAEVSA